MQHFLSLSWQPAFKAVTNCIAKRRPPHKIFLISFIMISDLAAKLLPRTPCKCFFFPEICFSWCCCLHSSMCLKPIKAQISYCPNTEISAIRPHPKRFLPTMRHSILLNNTLCIWPIVNHDHTWQWPKRTAESPNQQVSDRILKPFLLSH